MEDADLAAFAGCTRRCKSGPSTHLGYVFSHSIWATGIDFGLVDFCTNVLYAVAKRKRTTLQLRQHSISAGDLSLH